MTKLDALIIELLDCAKRNKCTDNCLHKGFCFKILKGRKNLTLEKIKKELAEDIYKLNVNEKIEKIYDKLCTRFYGECNYSVTRREARKYLYELVYKYLQIPPTEIKCDEKNNSIDIIENNILVITVHVAQRHIRFNIGNIDSPIEVW